MNLKSLNKRIVDRSDVFYWQAERRITEEEAAAVWKDRHSSIKNDYLIQIANQNLKGVQLLSIDDVDPNKQESNGSVNSNRVGHLSDGKDVIIRCHPLGVNNGYFYVESLVAKLLLKKGLSSYHTYLIHDCAGKNDCAFQIIEKIHGRCVKNYLQEHPNQEEKIVYQIGRTLAKVNKVKVKGFGPFNNELARKGILQGLHNTFYDFVVAGLDYDLKILTKYKIISSSKAKQYRKLFDDNKELLDKEKSVLIHNDFVDWNLLTDGKTINGIIDLDECVGGSPITDVACWSSFFKPERVEIFLKGYFSETKKPKDFDVKFQLLKLRYCLTKMTLRIKRYTYEQSDFMKNMIEVGLLNLKLSDEYFKIK